MKIKLIATFIFFCVAILLLSGCQKQTNEANDVQPVSTIKPVKELTIGESVQFGRYEQDNDANNGTEEIEWIVLEIKDNYVLLISRYALDAKPFDNKGTSTKWSSSSLRTWLNNDFCNTAFDQAEQGALAHCTIGDTTDGRYFPDLKSYRYDRVFLLNDNEVNLFFPEGNQRVCTPTLYAVEMGAVINKEHSTTDGRNAGFWWARTSGVLEEYLPCYVTDGFTDYIRDSNYPFGSVRPTIWVNMNAYSF